MGENQNRNRPAVIPDGQAWFWTPEWQAREAEADQEIAGGGGQVMTEEEFLADLRRRACCPDSETD